jgi:hypothetical protein
MNRRNFISKSSLAMIAAAGLPKAILNKPYSTSTYKTKLETGIVNQTYYELQIDHNALTNFASATDAEKVITLKVAYFETADFTKPTKGAEFTYNVKDAILINDIWKVKTKFDKKVNGDYKLPKSFPKNIVLMGKQYYYFNILDKKDQTLVEIPYPPSTSSGTGAGGCFLTTACVEHKKFSDDCNELTTLRFLRDEYMLKNNNDISLIKDYKIYGPEIVNAIGKCLNKNEIYEYMFQNMIKPSVALVKEERFAEAVDHYKIFVKALAEKYL